MIAVPVKGPMNIVEARGQGRALAARLGLSTVDQIRLATAISELCRNALQYGGGGYCEIEDRSDAVHVRIEVRVCDTGPGIASIEQAMLDGYSTGGGLGAGLPGTQRLMDEFSIKSRPGDTRITAVLCRFRAQVEQRL